MGEIGDDKGRKRRRKADREASVLSAFPPLPSPSRYDPATRHYDDGGGGGAACVLVVPFLLSPSPSSPNPMMETAGPSRLLFVVDGFPRNRFLMSSWRDEESHTGEQERSKRREIEREGDEEGER